MGLIHVGSLVEAEAAGPAIDAGAGIDGLKELALVLREAVIDEAGGDRAAAENLMHQRGPAAMQAPDEDELMRGHE